MIKKGVHELYPVSTDYQSLESRAAQGVSDFFHVEMKKNEDADQANPRSCGTGCPQSKSSFRVTLHYLVYHKMGSSNSGIFSLESRFSF